MCLLKKMFKVGDEIDCVLLQRLIKKKEELLYHIDLTSENPFETFEKKYPIGSEVEGEWLQVKMNILFF